MADYRVIDVQQLEEDLTVVADTIRSKTGGSEPLSWPDGYASAILSIEGSEGRMVELIRQFTFTEDTSGFTITTDDNGNPFRLERAVVTLNTNGRCDAGNSGAFSFYFGNPGNPTAIGLYFYGFPYRGYETSAGNYRNSGFNAYGSVKGGVALAVGHCGDFGSAVSNANYVGNVVNGYCADMKIERIMSYGTMPKNATISVYGERAVD